MSAWKEEDSCQCAGFVISIESSCLPNTRQLKCHAGLWPTKSIIEARGVSQGSVDSTFASQTEECWFKSRSRHLNIEVPCWHFHALLKGSLHCWRLHYLWWFRVEFASWPLFESSLPRLNVGFSTSKTDACLSFLVRKSCQFQQGYDWPNGLLLSCKFVLFCYMQIPTRCKTQMARWISPG